MRVVGKRCGKWTGERRRGFAKVDAVFPEIRGRLARIPGERHGASIRFTASEWLAASIRLDVASPKHRRRTVQDLTAQAMDAPQVNACRADELVGGPYLVCLTIGVSRGAPMMTRAAVGCMPC